jgi:hypothetical protein
MKRKQHVIVTMCDDTTSGGVVEARAEFLGMHQVFATGDSPQWVATVKLFKPYRSSTSDGGLRIVPLDCVEGCDMSKVGAR